MVTKDFQERCYYILNERDFIKTRFPAFMEIIENEVIERFTIRNSA